MSEAKAMNNLSLEDVVKAVLEVLHPEEVEEKENLVPEATVKAYKVFEDYPEVLQARHVRAILGISEAKTYEVLNSKKCPSFTIGKRILVRKDAFIAYLEASDNKDLID